MRRKISSALFWAIMILSVVAVSRTAWSGWRDFLWIGAFVVLYILLTSWFKNRFVGRRRRAATVMIYSVSFAMGSGSILLWDWMLFRRGFEVRGSLAEALVAGAVFILSGSVFFWSLGCLLRRGGRIPA